MPNTFDGKGNLGDAPTLKVAKGPNGEFKVAEMRVFFDRWSQDSEGNPVQVGGFWMPVQIYEAKAEACAKLLRKGARVKVEGELREFLAHDDDGKEVQAFQVRADDVHLVLSRIDEIKFRPPRERAEQPEAAGY
ncbi:MAG: single-stranded DNA-binding protein [Burkholderiales bacterium]|nr:MAG: single-stranded DNA-binding protein [Burkholderiales bacterium]